MKKKSAIIIAIILMSIGFAAISTTLIINGNTKVSENQDDFEVIFTKSNLDGVDVYSKVIDSTKKIINFSTNELRTLNQTSILTYEVTNNSSNYDAEVTVTCVPKTGTTAKYTSIKNKLDNDATVVKAKTSVNGTLTITLDKVATEAVTEEYTCKLEFNAVERTEIGVEKVYTEKLLNGTDPVLSNSLIPVTIANDGKVTYADITKEWYNYEKKIWANAVILEEGTNYKVGDVIQESDIQSYFVWIPRYRYKLFNTNDYSLTTVASGADVESKAQEIEIEFENKDTNLSTGSTNGTWLTHPAFTSFDTNGFWVGKFETGYKGATTTSEAKVNSNDTSKVIIKPNVYSWRGINVKNIFETSYNYQRDNDSHMMKNTEWGAVAYLSHSKYGIMKKVNINNNSSYKTGYSSLMSLNQNKFPGVYGDSYLYNEQYNTETGYLASATGNISGIYDMSGGSHEYLMAFIDGQFYNSGLSSSLLSSYSFKYYDIYSSTSSLSSYQNRILGDATGEMGPFFRYKESEGTYYQHDSWYNDTSHFVASNMPWFARGCAYNYGYLSSQFTFGRYTGDQDSAFSFRIVLTP